MFPILFSQPIAFTPAALGVSLVAWWDGQDPTATGTPPADGTAIATWVDKQGVNNLVQASGGSQPIYKTSAGINNRPSLDFSAKNMSGTTISGLPGNKSVTMFIVVNLVNENECAASLGSVANTGLEIGFIRRQVGNFRSFVFAGRVTDSVSVADANPHAFITTYDSATSELTTWVDGVQAVTTGSFTATNTNGTPRIGQIPGIGSMTGYIGEIGIMNTVCTIQQMSLLTAYLKARWGIA